MFSFIGTAARWLGRHTIAAAAAGVLVVGGVGGGIGYALAGQHTAAATAPAASPSGHAASSKARGAAAGVRGQKVVDTALAMLASQIGQSVASIRDQLVMGKSLAAIAGTQAAAVETEIITEITKAADKAVKSGKISAAQESTALATVKTRVDALMAEPGSKLIKDVEAFLQFLQSGVAAGATPPALPAASATP